MQILTWKWNVIVKSWFPYGVSGQQDYAYDDGDADDDDRNPVRVASKHLDPENTLILRQGNAAIQVDLLHRRSS